MAKLHEWMKKAARLRKNVEALGEACRGGTEDENGDDDNGGEEPDGSSGVC
jgi:hypothetical protein